MPPIPILDDYSISEPELNYENIIMDESNYKYVALIKKNIEKLLKNIDIKIKIVIHKKRYDKAILLKNIRIKLLKYLKESQVINNKKYLKHILNNILKLNKEILKQTKYDYNETIIDITIPKFNNEIKDLIIMFIYKFCKINHKILKLLLINFLKQIYYRINNSETIQNNYNFYSIYQDLTKPPIDKYIYKYLNHIYTNKLINTSVNQIRKYIQYLNVQQKVLTDTDIKNAIINLKSELESNNNIIHKKGFINIIEDFLKVTKISTENREILLNKYMAHKINYNRNNLKKILNDGATIIKYNIKENYIELHIDIKTHTYVYDNLMNFVKNLNNFDIKKYIKKKFVKNLNLELDDKIIDDIFDNKIIGNIKIGILIFILDILRNSDELNLNIKNLETHTLKNIFNIKVKEQQPRVYNEIIRTIFYRDIIEMNIDNDNNKNNKNDNIIIDIYKSKYNFINYLFSYIKHIFNKNYIKLYKIIKILLNYFKNKIIQYFNLNENILECKNKQYIKLKTFCLYYYNDITNSKKYDYYKFNTQLKYIIDNYLFKIGIDRQTERLIIYPNNNNTTNNKGVYNNKNIKFITKQLESDINLIKKDINFDIIKILCKFIENITNIFIKILPQTRELKFNINEIAKNNDSDNKNIIEYLNTELYKTENRKIRQLCIIIFIKIFIKLFADNFSKDNTDIDEILDIIITKLIQLFRNIKIEFDYNTDNVLDNLHNKNSWMFYNIK